jgi:hypothetical protein
VAAIELVLKAEVEVGAIVLLVLTADADCGGAYAGMVAAGAEDSEQVVSIEDERLAVDSAGETGLLLALVMTE